MKKKAVGFGLWASGSRPIAAYGSILIFSDLCHLWFRLDTKWIPNL